VVWLKNSNSTSIVNDCPSAVLVLILWVVRVFRSGVAALEYCHVSVHGGGGLLMIHCGVGTGGRRRRKGGRKEGVGSERDINSAGHYPLER